MADSQTGEPASALGHSMAPTPIHNRQQNAVSFELFRADLQLTVM
jgi:hypothetical protein